MGLLLYCALMNSIHTTLHVTAAVSKPSDSGSEIPSTLPDDSYSLVQIALNTSDRLHVVVEDPNSIRRGLLPQLDCCAAKDIN